MVNYITEYFLGLFNNNNIFFHIKFSFNKSRKHAHKSKVTLYFSHLIQDFSTFFGNLCSVSYNKYLLQ